MSELEIKIPLRFTLAEKIKAWSHFNLTRIMHQHFSHNVTKSTTWHSGISVTQISLACHLRSYLCLSWLGYRKVPKFLDAKKLRCKLPKIQTKKSNLRQFCQKGANGVANSEEPDQTAPLGAV